MKKNVAFDYGDNSYFSVKEDNFQTAQQNQIKFAIRLKDLVKNKSIL